MYASIASFSWSLLVKQCGGGSDGRNMEGGVVGGSDGGTVVICTPEKLGWLSEMGTVSFMLEGSDGSDAGVLFVLSCPLYLFLDCVTKTAERMLIATRTMVTPATMVT